MNYNCKIFIQQGERNEATSYYINILERALAHVFKCSYISSVSQIKKDDIVLVISIRSYKKVFVKNFRQKIIFWFQGVEPEELVYSERPSFRLTLKYFLFSLAERFILAHSEMLFFVSETMYKHYQKKYRYKRNNFVVMPCYNQGIIKEAFELPHKYDNPSFVYAGGLFKWQCIEESLSLYKLIKEKYPKATLTLLTKDKKIAENYINKYELKDVVVKFLPLNEITDEMKKYKYGFLLRENVVLNNVATPTKFNTYLALGIIPILSNVIGDYKMYVDNMNYVIIVDNLKNLNSTICSIDNLEQRSINPLDIYSEYSNIFKSYYNDEFYINVIISKLL